MIIEMNEMEKKTPMVLIRVDGCIDGVYVGTVSNPHLEEPVAFNGFDQLFLFMDRLFDCIKCPQATLAQRHFSKVSGEEYKLPIGAVKAIPSYNEYMVTSGRGNICTFFIKVMIRQNASWQGEVTWVEHRESISFRSALELMHLMVEAAQQPKRVTRGKTRSRVYTLINGAVKTE